LAQRGPRLFWRVALMAAGLFRPTMTGRKSAAALILLPCALLLIFGTWGSSAAAFLSASPAGRSALRGPQLHSMQEPRAATMCGSLPLVGLAAAVGCIVAARSTVQRRYTGSYNMDPRIQAGEPTKMTEEEKAEWLEKKTAELEELMPMTDIEFEDMVSEQTWQWARHLLPFQNRRRHEIAEFKRRCILKQPELFKKLRLWHPLALKYPTVIRRFDNLGPSDIENRDLMIDVEMLANTEKIAGFTYRDFLEETAGNKFNKEGWVAPEVGDTVAGTIMYLGEDGAFVELDCGGVKSWAQLPTRFASLKPIASVSEVNLEVGAKIETVVVEKDLTSLVLGDPTAVQYIVSLSSIELDAAWNKVERTMAGEEGYDPLWQVQVLQMASWGAQVMTEEGLIGMIPSRDLGDKAGDPSMVGANLTVTIDRVQPENRENTNPQLVSDYAIIFSYADVMKKVLAEKINEGEVVAAKITNFLPASMDIEVDGVPFTVSKVDISKNTRFDPQALFVVDEEIKVYCMSSDKETGSLRFSLRALERRPGALLLNKQKVFDEAEETAKLFYERQKIEKTKLTENLSRTLSEDDEPPAPAPKTTGDVLNSILGDEDEEF